MKTKFTTMIILLSAALSSMSQNLSKQHVHIPNVEEAKMFEKRSLYYQSLKKEYPSARISNQSSVSSINNIDFETNNFGGWVLDGGQNLNSLPIPSINYYGPASFVGTLNSGGTDPNNGAVLVSPLGGSVIARVNNLYNLGSQASKMVNNFNVNAANNILNLAYLPVFDVGGHTCHELPFLLINVKDNIGNILFTRFVQSNESLVGLGYSCTGFNNPGFYAYPFNTIYTSWAETSPWQSACVDLTSQIGNNVTVEVIVGECIQGGHGGYAYVDFTTSSNALPVVSINSTTYSVSSGDSISICNPTLNTFSAPSTASNINWNGPNGFSSTASNINVGAPGIYILTYSNLGSCNSISNYTNYIALTTNCGNTSTISCGNCTQVGPNLITNPGFESGNTGFSSAYNFSTSHSNYAYGITTNLSLLDASFCNVPDHTIAGNNYFWVDADYYTNAPVWQQTVSVSPNTNYNFNFWGTNLDPSETNNYAQVFINNVLVKDSIDLSAACIWVNNCLSWNSGSSSSAVISIVSASYLYGSGDDIGLDDIDFHQCGTVTPTISCGTLVLSDSCNADSGRVITATVINGNGNYNFTWSNGVHSYNTSASTISNLTPGNYGVTAISNTCMPGNNLIQNPDFDYAYTSFSSQYQQISNPFPTSLVPNSTGWYWVTSNPNLYYGAWQGLGYGGSGDYLVVDGAMNAGLNVWSETVSVNQNTNYNFSFFLQSLAYGGNSYDLAQLNVKINGVSIGNITAPSSVNSWSPFVGISWNSGSSATAVITIEDVNTTGMYNDFGLDHFSFNTCSTCTLKTVVNVGNCIPTNINKVNGDNVFNIYPNPTTGNLNIKTSTAISKIEVLNTIGQTVVTKNDINTNTTNVDLSDLSTGIYFVQIQTGTGTITKKIVKQ